MIEVMAWVEEALHSRLATMPVPLVYACSGGSGAGQVANGVAVCLDRLEIAEMSSTAGLAGGDPRHLAEANSGRPILAIDGCSDDCVVRALSCRGIVPILHIRLDRRGTERHQHLSYDQSIIERELAYVADVVQRFGWGESPDD